MTEQINPFEYIGSTSTKVGRNEDAKTFKKSNSKDFGWIEFGVVDYFFFVTTLR